MAKPRLQLSLKAQQQLAMTQTMQQSLKILEMPISQLEEFLEKKSSARATYLEEQLITKPSLFDHLMAQAREHLAKEELGAAEEIIGNLNEKGFYSGQETPLLKKIQQFDPVGIATQGPQQALIIQATGKAKKILEEHYDSFLKQRWEKIAKNLRIPVEEVERIVQEEIRPLHPFPGFPFAPDQNRIVLPDIIIEDGLIEIPGAEGEITHERWLLHALRSRKKLLHNLARLLLKREKTFFSGESTYPSGSTLLSLAQELEVTESTLSRACQEKWILCWMGMLPIKHFLQKNLGPKEKLKELIAKEEHPLSDEELAKRLRELGTPLSRRTVTKYREELGIGSKYQRKIR